MTKKKDVPLWGPGVTVDTSAKAERKAAEADLDQGNLGVSPGITDPEILPGSSATPEGEGSK